MRILILSDTHFYNGWGDFASWDPNNDGLNSRFLLQLTAFKEALEIGKASDCTSLVILGDIFHKRGQVEPEVVNMVKQVLSENGDYLESVVVLTGNHDITAEGGIYNTANILDGMDLSFPVTTIHKRMFAPTQGFLFVPFMADQEAFNAAIAPESMTKNMAHVTLFMHQSIFGAEYNRPITKGADPIKLAKFKRVFCGHIHQPQDIRKNVHIVGAPYPMNFGDNYIGSCMRYDTVENTVKRYQLKHPAFKTTNNPNGTNDYDFWRVMLPPNVRMSEPNVRVVAMHGVKNMARTSATNIDGVMKHYISSHIPKDKAAQKDMLAHGRQILKESQE